MSQQSHHEKAVIQKDALYPSAHCSTVYNSQDMEATYMSIDGWIKPLWYIYTMEYYSAMKRKQFESVELR